jgi:hypothetical protein
VTPIAALASRLVLPLAACALLLVPGPAEAAAGAAASPQLASAVRFVALPARQGGYVGALPEIYVEGEIGESILADLERVVAEQRLTEARVLFDSEGGDLLAAVEIGYFLRERSFVTEVAGFGGAWGERRPAHCHSACALAFLGGKYRFLDPASRLAVHQFTTPRADGTASQRQVERETQALAGLLVGYLRQMGVDLAFFDRMTRRPHEDLEWFGLEELRQMNVVNDGRMTPEWNLAIQDGEVVLTGRQERIDNSGSVTLRCRDGLEIEFATGAFDRAWTGALGAGNLLWMLGAERYVIREWQLALPANTGDGEFRSTVRLNAFESARLPAAPSVGLAAEVDGRFYEFRVDTGSAAERQAIGDFVGFCAGSGGARAEPAGAG